MNIFIDGHILSDYYFNACSDNLPKGLNIDEHCDFINAYDGCAFE